MSHVDTPHVMAFFRLAAERLEAHREALCVLDGEVGDGDHGTSMAEGFAAIHRRFRSLDAAAVTPASLLREAATAFLGEVGATVGPLYASGFLEVARLLDETAGRRVGIGELLSALATGIQQRGKAAAGDKTMLDALLPAAQAAQVAAQAGADPARAARAAAVAAEDGAHGTASMIASRGRAARLNERSLGHRDPGAVSAALLVAVLADVAEDNR